MRETLKFVVVGHVDHGKSTLIGRLLYDTGSLPTDKIYEIRQISETTDDEPDFAFVMGHLEEERSRRITIDTAQIFFKTPHREYVVIDAPGHRQFLMNMITGSTQAEAALLLVDAQEGLQEQTHRHAFMLSLLGMKQVIVVINKMDLVNYRQDRYKEICEALSIRLAEFSITPRQKIPVSARLGENVAHAGKKMPWYTGPTLLEMLDTLQPISRNVGQALRLPIQDIYNIEQKQVLVGRIASGEIQIGDPVVFHPSGVAATIQSILDFGATRRSAESGRSIGIILNDNADWKRLKRGEIACSPDASPAVKNKLTASVFWMSETPLMLEDTLDFKCATQQTTCLVETIRNRMNSSSLNIIAADALELRETEVAQLTLKMDQLITTDPFIKIPEMGRFVLMRKTHTIAGGIVIN